MVNPASKGRKLTRGLPEHSTQDLRSRSVERKREREHKQKWEPKWAHPGNPPAVFEDRHNGAQKPRIRLHKKSAREVRDFQWARCDQRRSHAQSKLPVLKDDTDSWRDPPAEEELDRSESASWVPNEDIKYSYDASSGPADGQEVLEIAVNKAVERFEDDQTTKLVKEEYEMLDSTSEADLDESHTTTDEDEGFELI